MLTLQKPFAEGKMRILLVDDDPIILRAMQRVLEGVGHEVVTSSSGSEAVATLTTQAFDVMVSDLQMPSLDGLSLLRTVREHDINLPVVLMTGNPDLKTAADAVEYGAFQYLIKPVLTADLVSVVEHAATSGKMARQRGEFSKETSTGKFCVSEPL